MAADPVQPPPVFDDTSSCNETIAARLSPVMETNVKPPCCHRNRQPAHQLLTSSFVVVEIRPLMHFVLFTDYWQ